MKQLQRYFMTKNYTDDSTRRWIS